MPKTKAMTLAPDQVAALALDRARRKLRRAAMAYGNAISAHSFADTPESELALALADEALERASDELARAKAAVGE